MLQLVLKFLKDQLFQLGLKYVLNKLFLKMKIFLGLELDLLLILRMDIG